MKRLTRDRATVCAIDHRLEPALRVEPGESFIIETEDAAAGYLRDESVLPYPSNRPTHATTPPMLNPVGGPVWIEGAEKGDVIVLTVEDIVPDAQGYTILQPGDGLLGDSRAHPRTSGYFTRILHHSPGESGNLSDGLCALNDRLSWPLLPHIGTLCLAPEREVPASVNVQGPYGGNLDSRDFSRGSRIHLQSFREGGMLFVGDVHGCQGDGELTGTANEVRAEVRLSCEIVKGCGIPHVRVEKNDAIVALSCGKPLESAVRGAVLNMLDWLTAGYGLDEREAYLMMGTCPEFRINVYQMVDLPGLSFTAGVELPSRLVS